MKNMMLKKVLSFLMALVMLFEMVPTSVLHVHAADNLCTHHTHDPAVCSYREEKVCTHTHNDDCYRLTCTHTQCDADCGYLPEDPGADCDCGAAEGEAHTLECAFGLLCPAVSADMSAPLRPCASLQSPTVDTRRMAAAAMWQPGTAILYARNA